ncbi:MAG: hypothetical protein DRJ50_03610 [Actinobacteria bacterium]|nr:MAG: hypothetical protein DRJ50_03610 [Actinomycetota bacterium]
MNSQSRRYSMLTQPQRTGCILAATLALLLTACSGEEGDSSTDPGDSAVATDAAATNEVATTDSDPEDSEGDLQDNIDEMAENLEATQTAQGGGTATLVVGNQEWVFESVLCAFGEEQIGQEGAVFNLSSIQDGMQMYASIDSFGHSVSLNDIEDFENPSVSLDAFGGEFILLDGKTVTAEAEFTDGTSESFDTVTGTFTASCP